MPSHVIKTVGTRAQVWHGKAIKTKGGLTRNDMFQDDKGRIRSKAASSAASRSNNLGARKIPKGHHAFIPGGMK